MELFIAGGCGEHGRNCFYVQGEAIRFLVDCGIMADSPEDRYPRLTPDMISQIDAVFLTHSHADHIGAMPWLLEHGFNGTVIASEETLHQVPWKMQYTAALETICPSGHGKFRNLSIYWGRSGHCAGSVWYRFSEEKTTLLFSGDYTEDTLSYPCDPIRAQTADIAVLDCAYGRNGTGYETACRQLIQKTKEMLDSHSLLFFPVPKFGRGLELLNLLPKWIPSAKFYGDDLFLHNYYEWKQGGFWYRPQHCPATVLPYNNQQCGIVFVSDPQLRLKESQAAAEKILSLGGKGILTGTVERGSFSELLLQQGKMELLCYPVHLNYRQYCELIEKNHFGQTIPYHSAEFPSPQVIYI